MQQMHCNGPNQIINFVFFYKIYIVNKFSGLRRVLCKSLLMNYFIKYD
jgi:hypothetical protein